MLQELHKNHCKSWLKNSVLENSFSQSVLNYKYFTMMFENLQSNCILERFWIFTSVSSSYLMHLNLNNSNNQLLFQNLMLIIQIPSLQFLFIDPSVSKSFLARYPHTSETVIGRWWNNHISLYMRFHHVHGMIGSSFREQNPFLANHKQKR